ncbi:hypothetical protein MTR_5g072990 [Medicago truncatula]|uniref:Uncharacterized protein n=1 Tax=Medicago truncatula TaxID=3880 RepID=G7KEF0_MEDTR|nr:hypothetical protein MTR_5g072990 [Medicago truncatula]
MWWFYCLLRKGTNIGWIESWSKRKGLGADSVRKYEDSETKICLPQSQKLGTTRASIGTAVPPSRVTFAAFPDRYIRRMVDYNELPRAAGYEVIRDDEDLYIIENLNPVKKLDVEKKVEDGVKIENDKSYNLDDVSIDLGAD